MVMRVVRDSNRSTTAGGRGVVFLMAYSRDGEGHPLTSGNCGGEWCSERVAHGSSGRERRMAGRARGWYAGPLPDVGEAEEGESEQRKLTGSRERKW